MGYKMVRFEEFASRMQEYWHPSDLDLPAVTAEVDEIAVALAGQGVVRLVFDDATSVLTRIDHRLQGGAFQEVWSTAEDPAAVVAARQQAQREAIVGERPTSFADMWRTYNGWDDYVAYARERFMTDETDFLLAVEAYRQDPSTSAQLVLFDTYIAAEAPQEVNIHPDTRRAIEERADGGDEDVFDAAQYEIMQRLAADFDKGFLPWLDGER